MVCDVCYCKWEAEGCHVPMTLGRCGHSLCSDCVSVIKQADGSTECPTCRVVSPAASVLKNYAMIRLLRPLRKHQDSARITNVEGRVGDLRVGASLFPSLHKPLVAPPVGSSLGVWEYYGLLGLIEGDERLRSVYRSSRDGTTYANLLRCVGDKTGLVFIIRKDMYVFGAFISDGIWEPDDPTDWHYYPCDVWQFSLAGHFKKPTKIEIRRDWQNVRVAGREEGCMLIDAKVYIGGHLYLYDGRCSGPGEDEQPAADIRSCCQCTHTDHVPEDYMGRRNEYGTAHLAGSSDFMADEIEVLHLSGQQ
ncbi:unnamed protein product [Vitrella brassicaformis CCMP3155]|uniref:RING-type domain-containing protein n=2 Tax=Vitrella brassicaformis TaxID=1169539 RepID=A0A0G4GT79_VITBC|nr:unnamed protein product [Vitrella brassicaformis CCMP3155]|eukprot:CEM33970.1 unnamed protein product [Vitrella brassicaformis CCMP3155]